MRTSVPEKLQAIVEEIDTHGSASLAQPKNPSRIRFPSKTGFLAVTDRSAVLQ